MSRITSYTHQLKQPQTCQITYLHRRTDEQDYFIYTPAQTVTNMPDDLSGIAELMSHLLPFKQRHGLQMTGVREHVEHAEAHQTVTPFHQHLTVPRQGDRVTGDVDHPLG